MTLLEIMPQSQPITQAFKQCQKRAALIPFVTAGFPHLNSTVPMLQSLCEAGADIIELGIPFSDPMADGAAIQRANEVALKNGISLKLILEQVDRFHQQTPNAPPIVLMGYTNSIMRHQLETLAAVGVSGLILVDLSDRLCLQWRPFLQTQGVDLISLIAPTTTAERIQQITHEAVGFLYYIALRGVTGAKNLDQSQALEEKIKQLRLCSSLPIAVGFGIRSVPQAVAVSHFADGVVIGSKIIETIEAHPHHPEKAVSDWMDSLVMALEK